MDLFYDRETVQSFLDIKDDSPLVYTVRALARDWLAMFDHIEESPRVVDFPSTFFPIIIAQKITIAPDAEISCCSGGPGSSGTLKIVEG